MPISRGFHRRDRPEVDASRVPPGQYAVTTSRSCRPAPHRASPSRLVVLDRGETDTPASWTWEELNALPQETFETDIHCVTKWTKLGTSWTGVSCDVLLEGVKTEARFVTAFTEEGYTTNLPLLDLTGGRAWVVHTYDGRPLEPAHGGPARLLVPHLYFWKSAKWVRGLELTVDGPPRLLGASRLPQLRRPLA